MKEEIKELPQREEEYINISLAPYALMDFLNACMCCGVRRIAITKQDNDLVARLSHTDIERVVYPCLHKNETGEIPKEVLEVYTK